MKTSRCRDLTSLAGFISALLLGISVDAATLTVTSTADAGGGCPGANRTLRQAIAVATPNDTINFAPGITTITLTSDELLINKNLTISGPGANLLAVQRSTAGGTPNFRIFNVVGVFNVTFSGLTIAKANSTGAGGGILNNGGTVTVIETAITGNTANAGGGIAVASPASTTTISKSTISGNSASGGSDGGGLSCTGGTAITNSTISGNTALRGGGIFIAGGTTTTQNSTITGNTANQGGGVYSVGTANNARNTIVAQNTVNGGSFPDFFGTLTSQGYNLIGNTSGITITGTTTGNQLNVNPLLDSLLDNGGPTKTHALGSGSPAIEGGFSSGSNTDQRGLARPVDSLGIPNASGGDGSDIGAYEVQADVLPGCSNINRVVNNNNDSGTDSLRAVIANVCAGTTITFAPNVTGAINLTSGELLLNKSVTINGPGANLLAVQRSAGAGNFRIFRIAPATVIANISGLTIANGIAFGENGGGISSLGTLTLTDATVSGNKADSGCGILNSSGTLTLVNSTVSGNTVTFAGSGGGIWNFAGTLTVINSTISGNSVTDPTFGIAFGGGIYNTNGGMVTLTNSTITGNTAQGGGGILNGSGGSTLRSRNTIIALNTAPTGPDIQGALTSENFNLIGNNSAATITPAQFSDQIGTTGSPINPLLGPLQNNGGPTLTRALLVGSPAIDKGHSSGAATDQRGRFRPIDDLIPNAADGDGGDIGAVEVSPPVPLSVASRKLHGGSPFDINLPFAGSGIECRSGGATNDYSVVFTFLDAVTFSAASFNGTGSISSTSGSGTTTITVNLTGVTNAQTIGVILFGVSDGMRTSDVVVPMGILVGDTNGDRFVNAGDSLQTRTRSGQAVNATNFRSDVNVDGSLNSGDTTAVRSRSGTALP